MPISSPAISWTGNGTPKSDAFNDVYYSDDNALAEIDYVFIQHNQLASRFQNKSNFCIAETGFGTGLNFLCIMQLWVKHSQSKHQKLHFISFEKFPLNKKQLQTAHQSFPQLKLLSEHLIKAYPYRLPGWHTIELFNKQIKLTLWFGDLLQGLPEMTFKVDAWLLDGFSPSHNPQMWQPALYSQMSRLSHKETTFATFTAAGEVRRNLQKSGFNAQKSAGFQNKREMCFGKIAQLRPHSTKTPWYSLPSYSHSPQLKTAIVVGAGIAGATVAYQLAIKGWRVRVLEKNSQYSQEASGNLAGVIHPLVTADWNLRSQWYLKGFESTLKWLKPWLAENKIIGNLNGLVHLAATETTHKRILESLHRVGLPADFAQWKTVAEIYPIAGCRVNYPGLFFPSGGWVQPASIVKACLSHPNIQCHTNTTVTQFIKSVKSAENWQVTTKQKQIFSAEVLIIATAGLDDSLNQQLDLPIRPVKGQVTHLAKQGVSVSLKTPLTHQGYSVSLDEHTHVTGATFEAPNMEAELSSEADNLNLDMANKAIQDWITPSELSNPPIVQGGKIGFRPTSPDHLPIIGPVAQNNFLNENYLNKSHAHASHLYPKQQYHQGLYVSNGHGARGLISVFLAAEIISDIIHQQPLNLPSSLYHASHPARFKIRNWRKGNKSHTTKT